MGRTERGHKEGTGGTETQKKETRHRPAHGSWVTLVSELVKSRDAGRWQSQGPNHPPLPGSFLKFHMWPK